MDHINFSTSQRTKLLCVKRCWLTHNWHSMRVYGQFLTAVIFFRHGVIRAFARYIARVFYVWKLIAPLICMCKAAQQGSRAH